MGKLLSNYGTQAKEKARQQKQIDKAAKRMLSRRKKAFIKKSLEEVAKSDGEINHLEKEGLFQMNHFGEL